MTAGTPPGRDRFVDLVRAFSMVAVVVGHWLVADLTWTGQRIVEASALREVPAMWPLTWAVVVIPQFFFVGGFANRRSWEGTLRRGEGYAAYLDRRVHRVLVPVGLYLAVIIPVGALVDALGGLGVRAMGGLLLQPLWFLGVYLWVVALVPLTLRAHVRFGWAVPVAMGVGVALLDLGRFGLGSDALGYPNALLVWLLMHQLGYHYVDGSLRRPGVMLGTGLAATAVLVALPTYSATMVGVPGGEVGNMHPPTLAMTALGVAQIGAVLLARPFLVRWLERPALWGIVVGTNLSVVTLYSWHQAALALAARIVLPLGYPHPTPGTPAWWVSHLLWLTIPGVVLLGLVLLVGRAERGPAPEPAAPGPGRAALAAVAVVLLGLGLLALAGSSATEPFARGQSLGPLVASTWLGVVLVGSAAALLRMVRAGASPAACMHSAP